MTKATPQRQKSLTPFWYGVTNRKWISIKALFFFAGGGLAALLPFLVVYYTSLGLKTSQIGLIEFLNIVITTIFCPIIGSIADKSGRHSIVLGVCIVAYLIPMTAMGFFSRPIQDGTHLATLSLNQAGSFELEVCDQKTADLLSNVSTLEIGPETKMLKLNPLIPRLQCKELPPSNWTAAIARKPERVFNCSIFQVEINKQSENASSLYSRSDPMFCGVKFASEETDNTWTFIWICVLRCLSAVCLGPSVSLSDSVAYSMLGPQHRGLWGQQRMFATLSFGISAGVMGLLIDTFHTFKYCFITFAVFGVATAFIAFFWLPKRLDHSESGKNEPRVPFCKAMKTALLSPIFCIICAVAIAAGILVAVTQVVWPQHMEKLGAPKLFFGLTAAAVCVFEIPNLFFAGMIVNLVGAPICFLLMCAAYAIRFGTNAFITPEALWLALPVEILHVFCFGLFFAAASRTAAIIAPPGAASTIQAILFMCYAGIGTGSGILLASTVYHAYGRYLAFLAYSAFAGTGLVVLLILYLVYLRRAMAKIAKPAETSPSKAQTKPKGEAMAPNDPFLSSTVDEL